MEKGKKPWNSNVVPCVLCPPVRALSLEAIIVDSSERVFLTLDPSMSTLAVVKADRRFAVIIDLSSDMVPILKRNLALPNALHILAGVHSCQGDSCIWRRARF